MLSALPMSERSHDLTVNFNAILLEGWHLHSIFCQKRINRVIYLHAVKYLEENMHLQY